ncbi:Intraflagellar transport protein 25 [Pleodorina starrii]|uniref:Intraflagellar transport protein 25 n=1 Tax=Pleodorina starrii TaxID=330485 RepID=A0A9W6FA07_9CHLO|nr:Intraflagellar transport protein 25 [Pleodorina starrii]GLC61275.1 Intraflagellar transport protein 25 [Pleodorina starrii]GLC74719.1 Intraflagellar transport protein 25 [Pleodorina starrii]
MKDYAREENGGLIVMASCSDERFPPENMLDGKDNTFWITTGMFPQEFVLKLESCIRVSKITTLSLNVRKLAVEKCDQDKPDQFEKVFEVELANRGDRLQTEVHQVNIRAKYLKFMILQGHGEFATVNRVSVVGGDDDGAYDDPAGYGSMQRQGSGFGGSAAAGFSGSRPGSTAAGGGGGAAGGGGGGFDDEF